MTEHYSKNLSKFIPWTIYFIVFTIGLAIACIFIKGPINTGFILNTNANSIYDISDRELVYLKNMLARGQLYTASDIISSFTAYYHTVISILITLIVLMAGLVTYSFYKSQQENVNLIDHEVKILTKRLDDRIANGDIKEETLNELSGFKNYLARTLEEGLREYTDSDQSIEDMDQVISSYFHDYLTPRLDDQLIDLVAKRVHQVNERGQQC